MNLISNLWGGHCFGLSRTRRVTGGKITTFNLGHPIFLWWHTTVHVPLRFLSEWRDFLQCLAMQGKKKLDDSSRLDVVEIARVA